MLRFFLFAILLFLISVASVCAEPAAAPASPSKIVPPASLQTPSMNGITRAAANAGVRTCLARMEQTGNFITANTQSKGLLFLPPEDVDRQVTSASYEVQLSNNAVAYASLSVAPTTAGDCDTLYETVAYWPLSCPDVAKNGFPEARQVGFLQQQIMVLQGDANLRVFLMPTGPHGCVAIKKEVLY